MQQENYNFYPNFEARNDLKKYNDNALLLYTLQLRFGIEDIEEVAINSLVDGNDDKKTDLVYIDDETGEAIIAQGFFASVDRSQAPSNKASDLNTAVTWLLTRELNDLPDIIRSAAQELRQKIENNTVKRITLWYSHNLPESQNVKNELKTAENTLASTLNTHFSENNVEAMSLEVGLEKIDDWYKALTTPILMTENIELENINGFELIESDWQSFSTFFPANKLFDLYKEYKIQLFSANVRDYLGSRRADSNINNGIKSTAEIKPNNFFVYNNGITGIVNNYVFDANENRLIISGMSIVNGAQTTGAIGSLPSRPNENMFVPIRLIKCQNSGTISEIVKYNNSQNKLNTPDFRSNDQYQKKITAGFKLLGNVEYSARRGGAADIIRRNPNLIPSVTAGQVLASFHGEPSIAYNDKSKIWDSDRLYSMFFNDQTTAKHIFLCYSLVRAIQDLKLKLLNSTNELLEDEQNTLKYLRSRGAIILLATGIAGCIEVILNRRVSNKFNIVFYDNVNLDQAMSEWSKIINVATSFVGQLQEGLQDGIKNKERVDRALSNFTQMMRAVRNANVAVMDEFASKISN
jgi:hypothetical protein